MGKHVGLALSIVVSWGTVANAQVLPPNFAVQNAAPRSGLSAPVGIAFMPDGRLLVGTKQGKVHVIQNGTMLSTPFIDLSSEILSNEANGLMDVAVHPDFANSPYVYLLYVVDPTGGADDDMHAFSRLTRYRVSSSDPNAADPASRQVLIGDTWRTGWPACSGQHVVGGLRFAADGTLLASAGEASQGPGADAGGRDPECFSQGRHDPSEDIGAYRSQYLGSLSGKIIRIDPETGGGKPSNPYYTGNPFDNQSRVWAYGMRNPFRFAIRSNGSLNPADGRPGTLYIADVGWGNYEEIDISKGRGGENFGWPCYEGPAPQSSYQRTRPSHHGCNTIGTPENPSPHILPTLYWHHLEATLSYPEGLIGACAIAGVFYTGARYPAEYRNAFFFADYESGWVKVAEVDGNDNIVNVRDFATGVIGLVDMEIDPISGDVFFASVDESLVRRIVYTGPLGDQPPVVVISAAPRSGIAPVAVQFSSAGSFDPEGGVITFLWDFGDNATSTEANPLHSYGTAGTFVAVLTVRDGQGLSTSKSVVISVSSGSDATPPVISDVVVSNISADGAVVNWRTDEPADSRVEYGLTASYGLSTPLNSALVVDHSVILSGLSSSTLYHFRVGSADGSGNVALSGDYTFSTTTPLLSVTGWVVNLASGQGIAGARVAVEAAGNAVLTDAAGRFSLANVPGVGTNITAAADGFFTGVATVSQANEELTIQLEPIVFETNRSYSFQDPSACGRCHAQQLVQWTNSPMHQAGMNTWVHDLYSGGATAGGMGGFVYTRDSVHRVLRPNAECAACHNPTEWVQDPFNVNMGDFANPTDGMLKGVQCEICHRLYAVDPNKTNFPGLYPGAVTMVMPSSPAPLVFGALGDAFVSGSQVMRAAYNPRLRSNICAACHEDNNDHDDDGDYEDEGSVPVEPTYSEWFESPYAVPGPGYRDCVDCHMLPYGATFFCDDAQRERDPNTIRSHDVRGTTPEYLENAVSMSTQAEVLAEGRLRVRVRLTNDRTGHHVPTGVSVRNMILLVEATQVSSDQALNYVGTQQVHALGGVGDASRGYYAGLPGKLYAKAHTDGVAEGVFYTEAIGVAWDNRLVAGQSDEMVYDFELPAAGGAVKVVSRLIFRRAFRPIVDVKDWTTTGHGQPLEDLQPPHYGHLMELNELTVNVPPRGGAGYALRFDGADDYVEIADNAILSGGAGKSLTVEAWVRPDVVSGMRPVVEKFLNGKWKDWGLQVVDGVLEASIESGGDNWTVRGGQVAAGVWTHVAFAFANASNVVRLFVNGVQVAQKALTKDMPDTRAVVRFGRHGYAQRYLAGELDEVRIWNYARSASEIVGDMNRELVGSEVGLIGYWPLNEGSGQGASDGTGRGSTGRLGVSSANDASDPLWVVSTAPLAGGAATPFLQLTSPNGGESWAAGSNQLVTWSWQGQVGAVRLEYSADNGASWALIVAATENDGSYLWSLPAVVSSQCLLRVAEAVDEEPLDASDALFAIVAAPVVTNYALRLDGVDDYVEVADNAVLSGGAGKSLTVEAWVKLDRLRSMLPVVQKVQDTKWKDWGLAIGQGRLTVEIENSGDNWSYSAGSVGVGGWTHVAMAFDNANNVVRLFVNGVEAGSTGFTKEMPDTRGPVWFGRNSYAGELLAGLLDEVRIWNYARSAAELRAGMNQGLSGAEAGLIGYWRLNEGTGQAAGDLTGNGSVGRLGSAGGLDGSDPGWVLSDVPVNGALGARVAASMQAGGAVEGSLGVGSLPVSYALRQNYPNPFNGATRIEYDLPEAAEVRLAVYDVLGREVRVLVAGRQPAGHQVARWDGRDRDGQRVGSGIYLYRLQAGGFVSSRKMLLVQ